jgi:pSer/pThr/pTyr-binding forkhead associated (FHA) protein
MQNLGGLQTTTKNLELFHVQTDTSFDLPQNFAAIRIGKPKQQFIPDIDVSELPNADYVSRLHAEIQAEKNSYYIVDMGSSNGTYLNNIRINPKQRYPLNLGDKIDLGHGSKVTFIFLNKQPIVHQYDTILNNPPTVLQIELLPSAPPNALERVNRFVDLVGQVLSENLRSLKRLLKR